MIYFQTILFISMYYFIIIKIGMLFASLCQKSVLHQGANNGAK
jgi:hypothetical protein